MEEKIKANEVPAQPIKSIYIKRAPVDRRSPVDRRILDMGPGYPGTERRIKIKDRRRGWEDRYGWERISKWSSSPLYSDLP
ncbi:MAG: hypothetical protein HUN04_00485 [Desulfobacter sp.]|nr:MAG: hypothetical protein HUN04_00485 [Desulfobacter sp.]